MKNLFSLVASAIAMMSISFLTACSQADVTPDTRQGDNSSLVMKATNFVPDDTFQRSAKVSKKGGPKYIGCSVRCSEKQMLKSPVKLLI